jgi:RNA polymerase sigma factor (sigma-70 family)
VTDASLQPVLRHITRLASSPASEEVSDGQLLERFTRQGEEEAFALLLRRHGGMVLGVGRRVLRNLHDAEDVLQATFLVLARKAASIRQRQSVAGWLYGVAYRLARKAKLQEERRQAREQRPVALSSSEPGFEVAWRELQAILVEELHRLPARYQAPLVLCYLEGKTQEEAARELGWPLGTVRGRAARARDLLRSRLARRGLDLSAALFGVALTAGSASASVPARLFDPTVQAALRFAVGRAPGLASARPVALAEAAVQALTPAYLKLLTVLLLTATLVTAGAGTLIRLAGATPRAATPTETSSPALKDDKEAERMDRHGDPLPAAAVARFGTARLWCGPQQVTDLAFSGDGKFLATVGYQGDINVWESAGGKKVRRYPAPLAPGQFPPSGTIRSVALSPDGKLLATFEVPGQVRMRDVATGKGLWEANVPVRPASGGCAFSPDGKVLATAAAEGQVQLWHAATGKKLLTCKGHKGILSALAFSADGKLLVSGAEDTTVRVWRPATGESLAVCAGHRDGVRAVTVSPDGKLLASAGKDNSIRLWDPARGLELRRWDLQGEWAVSGGSGLALQFGADGKTLTQVSAGGLWVYETATSKEVRRLALTEGRAVPLCLAPDGKTLAAALPWQRVSLWDVSTGKARRLHDGHSTGVSALAFSPDGKLLASGGWDRTIRLWRLADRKEIRTLRGHSGAVSHLHFSPDGKYLASASSARNDRVISVWEVSTGKEVRQLRGWDGGIVEMAFSPDGKLAAAVCHDGLLHVFELETGKHLRTTPCPPYRVAFSPDSKRLAFVDSKRDLCLWDPAAGKVTLTIPAENEPGANGFYPHAIGFSPDGKSLYKSNVQMQLNVWEASTGKLRRQVQGRTDARDESWIGRFGHSPLLFSSDGRTMVFPGKDGSVCLVEERTGRLRRTLAGRQGGVTCLALSADGKTLASGSADSTILVWDLALGK